MLTNPTVLLAVSLALKQRLRYDAAQIFPDQKATSGTLTNPADPPKNNRGWRDPCYSICINLDTCYFRRICMNVSSSKSLAAALFATLVLAALSFAAVPQAINYQGYLTNKGMPVSGPTDMTFSLYSTTNGSGAVWTSHKPGNPRVSVTPVGGVYSIELGAEPQPALPAFDRKYWLGVQADADPEMRPLQPLTSVPYALRATVADSLNSLSVLNLPTNGLTVGVDQLIASGGNVGIGTQTPSAKLDVSGTVNAILFTGDGSGLAGVAAASHNHDSAYWKTSGDAGTTPGINFIGTTDNTALEIKVNNSRVIRIEPNATSPKIIIGYSGNVAGAADVFGATVSGGGAATINCLSVSGTYNRSCANGATAHYSTVSGGVSNTATGLSSSVGGGSSNWASSSWSSVGGGTLNTAVGQSATVGGGEHNSANNGKSTVSGGYTNTASGYGSAIGGGVGNTASGDFGTIGGGAVNTASAAYSWAGGRGAKTYSAGATPTDYNGTFIWADSNNAGADTHDFYSVANDEFAVRARGGVRFVTAIDTTTRVPTRTFKIDSTGDVSIDPAAEINFGSTTRQMINLWGTSYGVGVQNNTSYFRTQNNFAWYSGGVHNDLIGNPGGGTTMMSLTSGGLTVNGALVPSSDRNGKENFTEVDPRQILEKVANLPIQQWNYKDDRDKTPHVGPMAQDFYAAFNIGPDDKHIATVDADGIALAAIKALKAENDALKTRLERLEQLLNVK